MYILWRNVVTFFSLAWQIFVIWTSYLWYYKLLATKETQIWVRKSHDFYCQDTTCAKVENQSQRTTQAFELDGSGSRRIQDNLPALFSTKRDGQRIRRPRPPLIKPQWYQRPRFHRDRPGLIRPSNKNNQPEINSGEDNDSLSGRFMVVPGS